MHRCIELARLGAGFVAPNPMVGSVLVYAGRIIGEGYHKVYGGPHAEPDCIKSVAPEDRQYISKATLYVSLEPCAHTGKTPPCADLIIANRIPLVVIGCRDPFPLVNGKGIEKLQQAGIRTEVGISEENCLDLNKRFFTRHTLNRPYVILKWAQTADGYIGNTDHSRLLISNEYSNRLVHKWRAMEMAIMVGTNTAAIDNPSLTNRYWQGLNPIRIVLDLNLRLSNELKLFDNAEKTLVFNYHRNDVLNKTAFIKLDKNKELISEIIAALLALDIDSVIIEGGSQLIGSFVSAGCWDEARVITNLSMRPGSGIPAPVLAARVSEESFGLGHDIVQYYRNPLSRSISN
jgi:diaminohydroxyphosphoribosylaminopyrimidine deaminase/5-amino-6-(5-phosphoribosylamino)uracil reductase